MTCIVGLEHKGAVWIGGDSAAVSGDDIVSHSEPKVFFNGPFLIGFSTSFRIGDLLRYALKPPVPKKGQHVLAFLATTFVDKVRNLFREKGVLGTNGEDQTEDGATFLIGFRGSLYVVEEDFQVYQPLRGYHAIGAGDNPALGSLYSSDSREPQTRVLEALKASEQFCSVVRAPFHVLHT
jgi:ATP-dependent protease HslVU (ClpYQ) peptidase subunit